MAISNPNNINLVCFKCKKNKRYSNKTSYCLECILPVHKLWKRKHRGGYVKLKSLKGERWRDVVGYETLYMVSNFGRIKSLEKNDSAGDLRSEIVMKQNLSCFGYLRIELRKDKKRKINFCHVLVGKAFIKNPKNKPHINHKNGIKIDNRVSNLEWVTQKENSRHALKTGLFKQIGEKGYFAKLTNKKALDIFNSNKTTKELMIEYDVSKSTIDHIKSGLSWKQITGKFHPKYKV